MGVTLARKKGAKEVIVVDIDAGKREAASKAGANRTIDGGTADAVQQIQAATGRKIRIVVSQSVIGS